MRYLVSEKSSSNAPAAPNHVRVEEHCSFDGTFLSSRQMTRSEAEVLLKRSSIRFSLDDVSSSTAQTFE